MTPPNEAVHVGNNLERSESGLNRVVIVTGASRGIGAATALAAAARGYRVMVNYQSRAEDAAKVIRQISEHGGTATSFRADTSNEEQVRALFDETERRLGPVWGLVNNAGVNGGESTFADLDVAVLRQTLEVNVIGYFLSAREAVRRMATDRGGAGGAIVNLSSVAAFHGSSGERVHYAASKGAINSFTIGLAKEVISKGIRINAVSPGLIATEMNPSSRTDTIVHTVPIRRVADPNEVAEAILFLLSDAASYIVGANLVVSGGR